MILFYLLLITIIFNKSSTNPLLFIDLSHTFNPTIPYFPTQTRFNFTERIVKYPNNESSFFFSTNTYITNEHTGTHIDAPYHFHPTGLKVDEIPLKNLISVNARIIDVSKQCSNNRNYLITIDDVKTKDLIIPEKDENTGEKFLFVLIFYTGWSEYWPDQLKYVGEDTDLQFPGLSEQLASYLTEKYPDNLVGIGIDTLSSKHFLVYFSIKFQFEIYLADYGQSKTYPVHQILAKKNFYGLENLALYNNLLKNVQENFFTLDIYPMKIGDGTGAPCRIIARIDNRYKTNRNWFGLLVFFFITFLIGFLAKVVYDFKYNPNKDF